MGSRVLLRHEKWVGEVVTLQGRSVSVGAGTAAQTKTFGTLGEAKVHANRLIQTFTDQGYTIVRSEPLDEAPANEEPSGLYDLFRERIAGPVTDAERVEALDALDIVLRKVGQWRHLERAYRVVLQHLTPSFPEPLKARLWTSLGEIYKEMGDEKSAERAFSTASLLKP